MKMKLLILVLMKLMILELYITSGGSGYAHHQQLHLQESIPQWSAAANSSCSAAGTITAIRITNAGLGYTEAPTITIGNPYSFWNRNILYLMKLVTGQQVEQLQELRNGIQYKYT
jgi:hypothetical protein